MYSVRGNHRRRDDRAVANNLTDIETREESVTAREGVAQLREDAATSREQEIQVVATTQAASDDHMMMLQQANERLTITTIQAQKLTKPIKVNEFMDTLDVALKLSETAENTSK